jgi:uncharacterized membrane protein YdbT with pleckstrin-like domain
MSETPIHFPTEQTVFATRLHWWALVSGVYVAAAAAALSLVPVDALRSMAEMLFGTVDASQFTLMVQIVRASAVTLLGIALVMTLAKVILRACTQCIVTDRRLILKTGALTRRSFELPLDRVEAISVSQSMVARLLGFGTLVVVGTGSTRETVRLLASPDEFRRHALDCQTRVVSRGHLLKRRLRAREGAGRIRSTTLLVYACVREGDTILGSLA